jgi:DNA-binding LacI/PurR family transcriptional regulator
MATIKEVATLADVSIATVSHYLNKTKFVADETGRRVQVAIDQLGYQRDDMAAWLKTAGAPVVFIVYPHADTSFFDDVAEEIESCLAPRGLNALRVRVSTIDRMLEGGALRSFLTRSAGVVVLGHSDEWPVNAAAASDLLPSVMLNWDDLDGFVEQGLIEHLDKGAHTAIAYLAERGHRDIGLMTGPLLSRGSKLLEGSLASAKRLGINIDPSWIVQSTYGLEDGHDRARRMLEGPTRPTALFTFGTQFAFGAIQACYDLGIRVPGEMSIISYIECRQAGFSTPPLTTVTPSIQQIAAHVVERITSQIDGRAPGTVTSLDIHLVERSSVRRLQN